MPSVDHARLILRGSARQSTVAERAYEELHRQIVLGKLRPGTKLEVERLSEEFGTSRIPLREALRSLESEGLVTNLPRRGAVVVDVRRRDIEESYHLLEAAELLAAKKVLQAVTPELIAHLREMSKRMRSLDQIGGSEEMLEAHRSFHLGMFEIIGYGVLTRHIRMLWYECERFVVASMPDPDHLRQGLDQHDALVAALESRDLRQFKDLIRAHLRLSHTSARRLAVPTDED